MRSAVAITLTEAERKTLTSWAKGRSTPTRLMLRAKIVLAAAAGRINNDIADELELSRQNVARWRTRFASERLDGIRRDRPRGGRGLAKRRAIAAEIIRMTTQCKPPDATHWSTRSLAAALGVDHLMVHRVWRDAELKPHLSRTFKVSNDPHFVEKLVDVVGLYLDPPERALVLCADEKSQIQALDRTQPGLPMKRGRAGTVTHDYRRNGTTTLFAAMEMGKGRLIAKCMKRHRHQEWIAFLRLIDRETPKDLDLHVIADNYAAHKHPNVKKWLAKHPRFHMHFIPTSSSWLNMVERWFGELTDKRIRRASFRNVRKLVETILASIEAHNAAPHAYAWIATAEEILTKVRRARAALQMSPLE
jgi:transposase